jgi:hypothetical protein
MWQAASQIRIGEACVSKQRVSVFIAGVLVLAAAGAAVHFHAKYQLDADRIRELEAELKLARAEVSEYQEKLRQAERIADELEHERDAKERIAHEHAARIDELEAKMAAMTEPPPPEQPALAALVEETAPTTAEASEANLEASVTTAEAEPALAMTMWARAETPAETPDRHDTEPSASDADVSQPETESTQTGTETARGDLERELEEVRAEKRELEIKHAALVGKQADGVPVGKVRVTTGLRLKGKVLVVNDRYSFVVLDLGARDGVEQGMVLILHRGRKFIGKCQVSKVYNRMAAADLVLDWMKDEVLVGDGARKF